MTLVNSKLRKGREWDLKIIMRWRMSPDITQYMCTDPKLTIEGQKKWFEKIQSDYDSFYWIYEVDGQPVGLVSLVDWDKSNSIIHTGAYIAEKWARSLQNIIDMNMNLTAYPFEKLHINKVSIEIMHHNVGQLNWAKRIGYVPEGILRQAIKKNGQYYDLHLFSILRSEWENIRHKIHYNVLEIEE